jgi:hypothetical protein
MFCARRAARSVQVRTAFGVFDADGNGVITLEEMKGCLTGIFSVIAAKYKTKFDRYGVTPEELAAITADRCFQEVCTSTTRARLRDCARFPTPTHVRCPANRSRAPVARTSARTRAQRIAHRANAHVATVVCLYGGRRRTPMVTAA